MDAGIMMMQCWDCYMFGIQYGVKCFKHTPNDERLKRYKIMNSVIDRYLIDRSYDRWR